MKSYLIAMLLVPALLMGWLGIQQLARRVAQAHPEFGPMREEGGGCGKNCGCSGNRCQSKQPSKE